MTLVLLLAQTVLLSAIFGFLLCWSVISRQR
jgi:hypothetical protein